MNQLLFASIGITLLGFGLLAFIGARATMRQARHMRKWEQRAKQSTNWRTQAFCRKVGKL